VPLLGVITLAVLVLQPTGQLLLTPGCEGWSTDFDNT
jgi:hypothetical protein